MLAIITASSPYCISLSPLLSASKTDMSLYQYLLEDMKEQVVFTDILFSLSTT